MSSPSSPAWVAASLAADSSAGAPSAPSSSTSTVAGYSCSGRMTDALSRSPCGQTLRHSTGDPGLDAWISSLAASPARTYPPPAKAPGSTVNARDSGAKWPRSLAKYDPATCSWKTAQYSLFEDSEPSSVTWPRWGTMRNGACWERPTWAPRTNGTGYGLWPTIRSTDADRGGRGDLIQAIRGNPNSHYKLWLTPCATDAKPITGCNLYQTTTGTVRHRRPDGKSSNRGLEAQVMMWPTPRASANENRQTKPTPSQLAGTHGMSLCVAANMWPTPQAGIHRGEEGAGPRHEQSERYGREYPDWPADPSETPESGVGRVVDGCPARVDRLKALGNGQVPRVASAAFTRLYQRLNPEYCP